LAECQIAPYIGEKLLQKLTRLDIEGWHTALRNRGFAARTIGTAHRVLGKALRDAEKDGIVMRNICKVQRAPKVKGEETTIVRDVPGLIEKLRRSRLYTIAITALFTGVRLGEIPALREHRVDLDRGVIEVREALEKTKKHGTRFKTPKTAAGRRTISLPAIVIGALREHRKELMETRLRLSLGKLSSEDLLFADLEGKPLLAKSMSKAWANFADTIGMPEVTFHALRHTHASQLIAQGVDIVTINKRLGHANPKVTLATYAHLRR
jgi:integrase